MIIAKVIRFQDPATGNPNPTVGPIRKVIFGEMYHAVGANTILGIELRMTRIPNPPYWRPSFTIRPLDKFGDLVARRAQLHGELVQKLATIVNEIRSALAHPDAEAGFQQGISVSTSSYATLCSLVGTVGEARRVFEMSQRTPHSHAAEE